MIKRLFVGVSSVSLATVAVFALVFIKDLVLAYQFGLSKGLGVFFLAYAVPIVVISVIVEPLAGVASLKFAKLVVSGSRQDKSFFVSRLLMTSALSCSFLAIAIGWTASDIYEWLGGSEVKDVALFRDVSYWLLPCIVFGVISRISLTIHFAEGMFFAVTLASALPPLIMIGMVSMFGDRLGVVVAAVGMFIGCALEMCVLLNGLRRRRLLAWHSGLSGIEYDRLSFLNFFGLAGASVAVLLLPIVDQFMLGENGGVGVAAMVFGNKLNGLFYGLSVAVIGNVLMVVASKHVVEKRSGLLRSFCLLQSLGVISAFIVSYCLISFSAEIAEFLFGRGRVQEEELLIISSVQSAYLAGLPGLLATVIAVRFLNAIEKSYVLLPVGFSALLLNYALNVMLQSYAHGAGYAFASSLSISIIAILLIVLTVYFIQASIYSLSVPLKTEQVPLGRVR